MKHLHHLIAATHTPFNSDRSLNLTAVEKQAAHLLENGMSGVFIAGTTGESHSLSLDERRALAQRWAEVARGTALRIIVHVGSNCLADARTLATQAQELGATAVAACSPSYFKPASLDLLIDSCAEVASAATETPFYFYDIPSFTGVSLPVPEFLEKAPARIPNLTGVKFTNPDLIAYQSCLRVAAGKWDVLWGVDELFLSALAVGAKSAIGSGLNFAAPVYRRLVKAFAAGDLKTAADEQFRGITLVRLLSRYGYLGAAKAIMKMLGVDVGPPRLPIAALSPEQSKDLGQTLEGIGFFDWLKD